MDAEDIVISDEIRKGVEAFAEKHGHAEVVAQDDDRPYVFVDIGQISIQGYGFDQEENEAKVILRVHKDFPNGQHYGMITIPVLTIDGRIPDHTTRNHQHAECLRQIGITVEYLYWSRNWQELAVNEAEDMDKVIAFVRGTLRNPFNN